MKFAALLAIFSAVALAVSSKNQSGKMAGNFEFFIRMIHLGLVLVAFLAMDILTLMSVLAKDQPTEVLERSLVAPLSGVEF